MRVTVVCALFVLCAAGVRSFGEPLEGNPLITKSTLNGTNVYRVNWMKNAQYNEVYDAECGDTVEFTWTGNHNVGRAEDGDCEQVKPFVEAVQGGNFTYTFKNQDEEAYFASTVGDDCKKGKMMVEFYINCGSIGRILATNFTEIAG